MVLAVRPRSLKVSLLISMAIKFNDNYANQTKHSVIISLSLVALYRYSDETDADEMTN